MFLASFLGEISLFGLVLGWFFFSYCKDRNFSLGVGSVLRQGAKKQCCEILPVQPLCRLENKRVGEQQAPGEMPLGGTQLVAVLSGTGVEPLNALRTFVSKTEAEAGTKEGFRDAACFIFLQV